MLIQSRQQLLRLSKQQDFEWSLEDRTRVPRYVVLVPFAVQADRSGYVMTDWGAQHAGIAGANAGLDMVMPNTHTWGSNLTKAISNGTMEASRLDDMATR